MWDSRFVSISHTWKDYSSLTVVVEDLEKNLKWMLTLVYGPVDHYRKGDFWREIYNVKGRWSGAWCLGGDWNAIRFPSERSPGGRISEEMNSFSEWINSHSLVDLQLTSTAFTWSNHKSFPIMFRLHRFLVSNDWMEMYPDVCISALPKLLRITAQFF